VPTTPCGRSWRTRSSTTARRRRGVPPYACSIAGQRRHDVMDQLVTALRPLIVAALADRTPFSAEPDAAGEYAIEDFTEEDYVRALDRLPLPPYTEVEEHYLAAAREARVIPVDELEHRLADRLGLPVDDPLTDSLLAAVDRAMYERADSPLIMLAGDSRRPCARARRRLCPHPSVECHRARGGLPRSRSRPRRFRQAAGAPDRTTSRCFPPTVAGTGQPAGLPTSPQTVWSPCGWRGTARSPSRR